MNNNKLNYVRLPDGTVITIKEIIMVSSIYNAEEGTFKQRFDILLKNGIIVPLYGSKKELTKYKENLHYLIGATEEFIGDI